MGVDNHPRQRADDASRVEVTGYAGLWPEVRKVTFGGKGHDVHIA
jgi:hypothetical protein